MAFYRDIVQESQLNPHLNLYSALDFFSIVLILFGFIVILDSIEELSAHEFDQA